MASTVEGIFRILDRASEPMRRMERQARQTDRAIEHLALTTDMIGGTKQQRQMNDIDRSYRTFGRTLDDTGGRVRRLSRDVEQNESRWARMRNSVTQAGAALMGVGKILGVIKLPAMGAGIGILVQGVGALAGGIIALLPRVADLAGGIGVLGPSIAGLGLAMITTRLATHGLTQALAGNQQAIRRLTPQARQFVATLKEYHGIAQQLRGSAQGGLFAGFNAALPRLTRGVPVANQLLRGMSATLGGLASQAANRITTPGFLQDILGIGQAGTQGVGRAGTSLINILSGMRHLTVAAIPFTSAVTRALVRFSEWFDKWAQFQRDSGRAAAFFERSRKSFDLFGHIIRNLWTWFTNLGRAARGTGNTLWAQAERATRAWAKWSGTLSGQIKLTRDFVTMRAGVSAIVTLFDDLVRAIFNMGTAGGLAGIVNNLDKLIPSLVKLLNSLANTWGPLIVQVLDQIAKTLAWLVAGTGPLTIFLTLLNAVFRLLNGIAGAVPGLGHALAAAFSVVTIGLFINKLRGVSAGWLGVTASANAAAAAEARALALAGGGAGGAGGGLVGGMIGGRITGLAAGESVSAGGVVLPAGVEAAAAGGGAAGLLARGRGLLGRTASRALGLASRFALPVTAALGAYGALTASTNGGFGRQFLQRGTGALNAISFGGYGAALRGLGINTGGLMTPDQLAQRNINRTMAAGGTFGASILAQGGQDPHTRAQLTRQIALYEQQIADYSGRQGGAYKVAVDGLRQQLTVLRQVGSQLRRNAAFNERAGNARFLRQEGGAFDILAKKFGSASAASRTNADVLSRIRGLKSPQAKQSLAQNYLSWLSGEDKRDPKQFGAALQQFERAVGGSLGVPSRIMDGRIVSGTAAAWAGARGQLSNPVERARELVSKKLTQAQTSAVAILSLLGASPSYAAAIVRAMENSKVGNPNIVGWGRSLPSVLHRMPKGGPSDNNTSGFSASGLQPGVSTVAQGVLSQFPGLSVTSTLRPMDKGSYHSIGEAVDIAGPPSLMNRAARWIAATMGGSLLEGIHNSGLSIKNGQQVAPSFWGASTWAGHANHIHLAAGNNVAGGGLAGGLGGGGGARGTLTGTRPGMLHPRRAGLAGVPGTLADQLGLLYAASPGSRSLASSTGTRGAGLGVSTGTLTGNKKLAYQMMSARWPASEWANGLLPLWTGESGFNNMARNSSSGAFGIPQALPASKMGAAAVGGDPIAQIAWGLNYIAGRYGTPSNAYKTWLGRKPHWYRDGGSAIYRRPTMIGVGDNPRGEQVTVTPLGGKTAGASGTVAGVQVHIGTIINNEPGDIQKIVWREFEALARDLEHGGHGSEGTM